MLNLVKQAKEYAIAGLNVEAQKKYQMAATIGQELIYNAHLREIELEEQKNETLASERRSSLKQQAHYSVEKVVSSGHLSSPSDSVANLSLSSDQKINGYTFLVDHGEMYRLCLPVGSGSAETGVCDQQLQAVLESIQREVGQQS